MKSLLLLIVMFGLFTSCTQIEKPGTVILARVNGNVLTKSEALSMISPLAMQGDSVKVLEDFRDQWIEKQLILREANRLRVDRREIVRSRIEESRNDILVQALRDFVISENMDELEVTDDEVQQYYLANKEQFVLRERHVRYRHITTASLSDAEAAKRGLLGSASWESIIERYSIAKEENLAESKKYWPISDAGNGIRQLNTYLGLIGNMEISPITRSGNTYHFVQLTSERAAGEHPELEWLMEQIREWLIIEKSRRYYNSYVKNLYLQATANNELQISNVEE